MCKPACSPTRVRLHALGAGFGFWLLLLISNWPLINSPYDATEIGDSAADSLLIRHGTTLTHGHFSQYGFFHFGPYWLWTKGVGQLILSDWLHALSPIGGQEVARISAVCGLTMLSALAVSSATQSVIVLWALPLLSLTFGDVSVAVDWGPTFATTASTAVLGALVAVVLGRTRWVPVCVTSGLWAVNAYLPAAPFAAALAAFAPTLCAIRGTKVTFNLTAVTAALAAVLVFPTVAGLIAHWPGELGNYLGYLVSSDAVDSPATTSAYSAAAHWFPGPRRAIVSTVGGAITFMALLARLRSTCRPIYVLVACASAAPAAYFILGVRNMTGYQFDFLTATPVVAMSFVLGGLARDWTRCSSGLAVAFLMILATLLGPGLREGMDPVSLTLMSNVSELARESRGKALVITYEENDYPYAAAALLAARRLGLESCVPARQPPFWMTEQEICTSAQLQRGVRAAAVFLANSK